MSTRVTIQDIADELGVSRNTVSKAINNTGILADATKEKVLRKAAEMGYKQFSYADITAFAKETAQPAAMPQGTGSIAMFSSAFLSNSHFASTMLDSFQREISQLGYSLVMYRILSDEMQELRLPSCFQKKKTAGIICFELFNYEYCKMLCDLDIPVLFVDTPVIGNREPLPADCLYMNNQSHICTLINEMVSRGKSKIGFVGDYMHCQSFYERYMGYVNALFLAGIPYQEKYCVIGSEEGSFPSDVIDYSDYIRYSIAHMQEVPEVFICANDFVATHVLTALKEKGLSVPQDVYLCGFDDSPESTLITPPLTTIHIHTQIMGFSATHLLMSRINQPSLNYRTIYTETDLIYRESTGDAT